MAASIYETAIRHRVSPEFIGSRYCVPMAFTAESPPAQASKPQGSSERVLPGQITMDRLIFASLSHTHYWYEVGVLKVPAYTLLAGATGGTVQYTKEVYEIHSINSSIGISSRCQVPTECSN